MNVLIWVLTAIHVVVALFLIVLVLMQKSQDQGVGAAFGAGMTETVFGAGTTTVLVRLTIWCAAIMLGLTLVLAMLHAKRSGRQALMERAIQTAPAGGVPAASQLPLVPESVPATPAAPATETAPAAPAAPATESAPAPASP